MLEKETNQRPLVSAIITTHNRKDLLKKALESVVTQTYPNIEIIVVDDGSDDGTKEYMEDYLQQHRKQSAFPLTYVNNAEGKGGNHARNTGISISRGAYVAFLDDDDEWMMTKTEKQVAILEAEEAIGVVSCVRIIEYDAKKRKYESTQNRMEGDLHQKIFTRIPFTTSCMMVRRQLLVQAGLFDEKLKYWQEYDLAIRMCQRAQIKCIKEHLVLYRFDSLDKEKLTNHLDGWEKAVEYLEKKYNDVLRSMPEEIQKAHRALIARDGIHRAENSGDNKRKKQYLKRLLEDEPSAKNMIRYVLNRSRLFRAL